MSERTGIDCPKCGDEMEAWVDCPRCGGDGYVEEPNWEDGMFGEPERRCPECRGRCGWKLCWHCASPEALEDAY